jgi:hypothetical protein
VPSESFVLGRKCTFSIDGILLKSVRDVGVRSVVSEHDVTGYGHANGSTLVTRRTFEIDVEVQDAGEAALISAAESGRGIVTVATTNGHRAVSANFTVCDCDFGEPMDGVVRSRFTLRQWMHGKDS